MYDKEELKKIIIEELTENINDVLKAEDLESLEITVSYLKGRMEFYEEHIKKLLEPEYVY